MASLIKPIVIVGGGPVGATFALSLPKNQPVTLLEAREQGASHGDARALALSHNSRLILEKMGIWKVLSNDIVAINTIHISQKGSFGRTVLKAHEHDLPSLGTVLPYGKLNAALSTEIAKRDNIHTLFEATAEQISPAEPQAKVSFTQQNQTHTLESPLVVVADGGRGLNEIAGIQKTVKEYGDDALVAKVRTQLPHNHIAYERFTPQGPMALLPNGDDQYNYSLVWTGKKAYIDNLLALCEADLLQALHAAFGDRVGQFFAISKPLSFPLRHAVLKPSMAAHVAIIGNAAQTMHPVAGQGFNVGMRDAISLAQAIQNHTALGSQNMLQNYQQTRVRDTRGGLLFTDFLVNVFGSELIGVSGLRGAGLGLLDIIKPAKKLLVDRMSFGA